MYKNGVARDCRGREELRSGGASRDHDINILIVIREAPTTWATDGSPLFTSHLLPVHYVLNADSEKVIGSIHFEEPIHGTPTCSMRIAHLSTIPLHRIHTVGSHICHQT